MSCSPTSANLAEKLVTLSNACYPSKSLPLSHHITSTSEIRDRYVMITQELTPCRVCWLKGKNSARWPRIQDGVVRQTIVDEVLCFDRQIPTEYSLLICPLLMI